MFVANTFKRISDKAINISHIYRKQSGTVSLANNIIVSNLKLPKLFGPTGEDVMKDVDLSNKTCLITGGTTGIGSQIVRCLISKNCNVVMACRNVYAANMLAKKCMSDPNKLILYEANLVSLNSVKAAADEILKDKKKFDIVFLNAAVFGIPWTLTEDGLETIFQVNFLSQFYFLMSIEKALASDARVIIMSCNSHRHLKWPIQNIVSPTVEQLSLPEDKYTSLKAYNISKLCGILAMHYLSFRWSNKGKTVICADPGSFIKTELCTNWWPYELLYSVLRPFCKNAAQGAATPLFCATSPELENVTDVYFRNFKEREVSSLAHDTHLAFRIIDLSKEIINERIKFVPDPMEISRTVLEKKLEQILADPAKAETVIVETIKGEPDKEEPVKTDPAKTRIDEPVLSS